MKLWNKGKNFDKLVEEYTIGDDPIYDLKMASYDVQGSMAHAEMLLSIGYLTKKEHSQLQEGLQAILKEIIEGQFHIAEGVEDIHSQVEFLLIERIGEAGKKLHVGRSRNDQVAVDLKLYYRDRLEGIKQDMVVLIETLLNKAESSAEVLMPGYTHSQAGMISSFGLWYGSFAEALIDDLSLLTTVMELNNQCPLGSAAGYGSSLPNDRALTSQLLGFARPTVNAIYAQNTRGKTEFQIASVMASISLSINRLASDICIYSNENYHFLKLPDEFTTGSSIMPHKKNPDVLELTRAKCNQLMALPSRLILLMNNMQTGYHRDYQLLKEIFFPEIDRLQAILTMVTYCIPVIEERKNIMDDSKYDFCYTVENINSLTKSGLPFREAYHQVKSEVESGKFIPNRDVNHTHLGSLGNLGIDSMRKRLENFK